MNKLANKIAVVTGASKGIGTAIARQFAAEGATAGIANSDFEREMIAVTPLGRAAQPLDIALPAVFLASDDARFVTGETLYVGGGAGM